MRSCIIVGIDHEYNKKLMDYIVLDISLDINVVGEIELNDFFELSTNLKPSIIIVTQTFTKQVVDEIKKFRIYEKDFRNYDPFIFTILDVITTPALKDMKDIGVKKYYLKSDPVINLLISLKNVLEDYDRNTNSFLMENTHNIDTLIYNTMLHLGVPINNKGFNQIQYMLLLCYKDKNCIYELTQNLYFKVAEEYKTSTAAIERNMRVCISKMKINQTNLYRTLFSSINPVTNKVFLNVVLNYIKTAPYQQYVNVHI